MENSFFAYLQRLEVIAFFSGYPLVYAVVLIFAGNRPSKKAGSKSVIYLLPYGYALVGVLYLGLQLKKLYPDYSFESLSQAFLYDPFLITWAILSNLFWIPVFARKPVLSLLHSLVFLFLLMKDIFFRSTEARDDSSLIRNDMKLYTASIVLNLGALLVVTLVYFIKNWFKDRKDSRDVSI